ncbi:hypothetical protein CVIRNUC_008393 [Coccomyxa viridis]|uniref:Cytokinin riboside 5'-monophosphate phosphoribohydrolase n=1 Tax=Coccomyxa viridis TaxID=1274662 RepID=A0AAV1IG54_9CHLO|nr:hypothetical protein CVIRNUC_008393 [Coccomyxa viridis]
MVFLCCTGAITPCSSFCQVVSLQSNLPPMNEAHAMLMLPGGTGMQHWVHWWKLCLNEYGDCKPCCTASSVEGRGVQPHACSGFVLWVTPSLGSLALQIRQFSMLCCCGGSSAAVEMESLLGRQSARVRLQLFESRVIVPQHAADS